MQRSSLFTIFFVTLLLAGCNRPTKSVFVDLNEILKQYPEAPAPQIELPSPPAARPLLVETAPGAPAVFLQDPANGPTQNIPAMFQAEQAKAFSELEQRLRRLYSGEVQAFRLQQLHAISGDEQAAYETANVKIRPLFDAWAIKRAPKFARLAILAGFPDPNPDSKPIDKSAPLAVQQRSEEAKIIRLQLSQIDTEFHAQSKALLDVLLAKSSADRTALLARIQNFADKLDLRAHNEAKAQIRQAASQLTFKLANPTPIILPPTPASHITIPAEKPLDSPSQVPSGGILGEGADRKKLLEHELQIWLALNRYTLASERNGNYNATQEFQIWRQQHGTGP